MRTLILLATSAAILASSLPVWACGMPPREELVLADAFAEIDDLLVVPGLDEQAAVPVELVPVTPAPEDPTGLSDVAAPPAPAVRPQS